MFLWLGPIVFWEGKHLYFYIRSQAKDSCEGKKYLVFQGLSEQSNRFSEKKCIIPSYFRFRPNDVHESKNKSPFEVHHSAQWYRYDHHEVEAVTNLKSGIQVEEMLSRYLPVGWTMLRKSSRACKKSASTLRGGWSGYAAVCMSNQVGILCNSSGFEGIIDPTIFTSVLMLWTILSPRIDDFLVYVDLTRCYETKLFSASKWMRKWSER